MGKHKNNFYFRQIENEVKKDPSNVERNSVIQAMKHFIFHEYDFIFKITGKYIIPCLPDLVKYILPSTELILQHIHYDVWQNSEIFGIRTNLMYDLMRHKTELTLEKSLSSFSHERKIQRLAPIGITPEWRTLRSFGDVLTYL